jgi:hypothetical protein
MQSFSILSARRILLRPQVYETCGLAGVDTAAEARFQEYLSGRGAQVYR